MTTPYRKKLIEVALPLEAINREAAREKSIRHGHPSTLHLWWARRPLAACRAVIFASLVDDPSECVAELLADPVKRRVAEKEFKAQKKDWDARKALFDKASAAGMSFVPPGLEPRVEDLIAEAERQRLFRLIEELVKWDNCNDQRVLKAAHQEILRSTNGSPPPIYDPFCGGGSIPVEAQRLGLEAHASDLNPVAVLINKALIQLPATFAGQAPVNPEAPASLAKGGAATRAVGMSLDLRYYGERLRTEAEKLIANLYPKVRLPSSEGSGETIPIAYLWARTIECPNPACRARMPLIRSFWLSKKKGNIAFAQPVIDLQNRTIRFEVKSVGTPPIETTDRTGARCIFCERGLTKSEVREQAMQFGVRQIPMALVCEGRSRRIYLPVTNEALPDIIEPAADYLRLPITNDRRWFSPPLYGLMEFRDLFTPRQLKVLDTFCALLNRLRTEIEKDAVSAGLENDHRPLRDGGSGAMAYADTLAVYLAFGINKAVTRNCTLALWEPGMGRLAGAFGRQAMPMIWLFAETNPLSGTGGDIAGTINSVAEVVEKLPCVPRGTAFQQNAATTESARAVISTDPPYYDNIGYADLSDFFYIWLRHSIGADFGSLFGTVLVPKAQELIASAIRFDGDRSKADKFFEEGLLRTFKQLKELHLPDYPLSLFYAFKQAETDDGEDGGDVASVASTGWETMLEGLLKGGFSVHGTWPMRTELVGSLKKDISALASSIVLVCRPRPADAEVVSRRDFLAALRRELPEALRHLQKGNIAPVDLAQAAIGPGMAVFSRYAQVMENDGTSMGVRTALALINQTLDQVLAEQEGEFDGETRWALAWFDQHGFAEGPYGVAETLCTAKNTAVSAMAEAGILVAKAGKVRLLRTDELLPGWDPNTDKRFTIWEATHHLVHALDAHGEEGAADLTARLGGARAELARDLSYRLYTLCERRKWAKDALQYNALVQAWPEATRLAASKPPIETFTQTGLHLT